MLQLEMIVDIDIPGGDCPECGYPFELHGFVLGTDLVICPAFDPREVEYDDRS